MSWIGAHCAFAVETFTQRIFHAHFVLCQNDTIPDGIFSL